MYSFVSPEMGSLSYTLIEEQGCKETARDTRRLLKCWIGLSRQCTAYPVTDKLVFEILSLAGLDAAINAVSESDNGIGVPARDPSKLVDRFFRWKRISHTNTVAWG